ncbi:CocE/NonD family hydrolase [Sinorhizobium psoraleae]
MTISAVRRGYVVVVRDVRGREKSEGASSCTFRR